VKKRRKEEKEEDDGKSDGKNLPCQTDGGRAYTLPFHHSHEQKVSTSTHQIEK